MGSGRRPEDTEEGKGQERQAVLWRSPSVGRVPHPEVNSRMAKDSWGDDKECRVRK